MDLETTVTELAPRLLRYCLGRTRDPALAEDVAQEALVALVRRWRRWGPPESPEAFVFSIARRRAWRRVWERRLLAPLSLLGLREDASGDPERHTLARLEASDALRALRTLRAADREVLLLVVVGELSGAEAAAVLAISLSALKMRLLRARARWQQAMEDRCDDREPTRKLA